MTLPQRRPPLRSLDVQLPGNPEFVLQPAELPAEAVIGRRHEVFAAGAQPARDTVEFSSSAQVMKNEMLGVKEKGWE